MIDSHAHLEWESYDKDRDEVIEKCKGAGLKAVISVCTHPKDLKKTLEISQRYKNFVFPVAGIHPEYVKEIKGSDRDFFMEAVKSEAENFVAIKTGLDYFWVKESSWKKNQQELFIEMINFSKELNKPLVVHCRDAYDDVVRILEQEDAKQVHLHMWGGFAQLKRVMENGWLISIGPIIERSKKHKKIARDMPLDMVMLETDSPWFGKESGKTEEGKMLRERGDPTNIRIPAEKIAEVKKIPFDDVWIQSGRNAARFFRLPINV